MDFFESALVESGVLQFSFGPRARRPLNPFTGSGGAEPALAAFRKAAPVGRSAAGNGSRLDLSRPNAATPESAEDGDKAKAASAKPEALVTRVAYEKLQEKLTTTEELLEEAFAEATED